MHGLHFTLRPLSAFGGPLKGDTLFGQLCWALRNRYGHAALVEWLEGYGQGAPFLVCSDAFPAGYLPRPALPLHHFTALNEDDRKAIKRRRWLPHDALSQPVSQWLAQCQSEQQVFDHLGLAEIAGRVSDHPGNNISENKIPEKGAAKRLSRVHPQPHNSLSRLTGSTGTGAFAPYSLEQHWFPRGLTWDVYCLVDEDRFLVEELVQALTDLGQIGYGRDASIGLGKFAVENYQPWHWPTVANANACFTLAPCAPQALAFNPQRSHYEVFTRFGRHGDEAVHLGSPFKTPLLLAQRGAVLVPIQWPTVPFIGQGLGGAGELSKTLPATVHQGYTPFIAICLEEQP